MSRTSREQRGRRVHGGAAAVEFAIPLPMLGIPPGAPLFIGRIWWHRAVTQKAAHDFFATQYAGDGLLISSDVQVNFLGTK